MDKDVLFVEQKYDVTLTDNTKVDIGLLITRNDGSSKDWDCELFGIGKAVVIRTKNPPNRFWRWMQYLCFGNRWIKS
jgi:hypothetical protein